MFSDTLSLRCRRKMFHISWIVISENSFNKEYIQVLDLYVYNLAMGSGGYSLSVAVSILKTIVSIILLTLTNGFSKLVRGEGFI